MQIFRQLRAALVIIVIWCLASGLTGVLFKTVVHSLQGRLPSLFALSFSVRFFGILGLAFGATFALTFGLLGRFLPERRVPTWLAALVGGVGAPLGGTILLASVGSTFIGTGVAVAMAVVGTGIGAGIGFTANRARLTAGDSSEALTAGGVALKSGERTS